MQALLNVPELSALFDVATVVPEDTPQLPRVVRRHLPEDRHDEWNRTEERHRHLLQLSNIMQHMQRHLYIYKRKVVILIVDANVTFSTSYQFNNMQHD